jgi:uncharacterized membrane protein YhiD involved in acid resistance
MMPNLAEIPKTVTTFLSETNSLRLLWNSIKSNVKSIAKFLLRNPSEQLNANNTLDPNKNWNKGLDFASFILYFVRLFVNLGLCLHEIFTELKKAKLELAQISNEEQRRALLNKKRKEIINNALDKYLKIMVNDLIWGVANFITSSIFSQIIKAAFHVSFPATLIGTLLIVVDVIIAVAFYYGRERKKFLREKAMIEREYTQKILENENSPEIKNKLNNEKAFKIRQLQIQKELKKSNMITTVIFTSIYFLALLSTLIFASTPIVLIAAPILGLLAYSLMSISSDLHEIRKLEKTLMAYENSAPEDFYSPEFKQEFIQKKEFYQQKKNILRRNVRIKTAITVISCMLFISIGLAAPILLPLWPAVAVIVVAALIITIASMVANKKLTTTPPVFKPDAVDNDDVEVELELKNEKELEKNIDDEKLDTGVKNSSVRFFKHEEKEIQTSSSRAKSISTSTNSIFAQPYTPSKEGYQTVISENIDKTEDRTTKGAQCVLV